MIAFALRVAAILVRHTYRIKADLFTGEAHFQFGYETGRIAASIASGHGFGNPFHGITGPTAWLAPLYPYLAAGVFRIFGIYTDAAALVLLVLNSAFAALVCVPLFFIARELFGVRVARWSAWTWALLPSAMYWAIKWIWDTSLSALLVTTAVWLTIRLQHDHGWRTWLLWGTVWATIALTNPSCCAILPFAGIWLCYRRSRQHLPWFWRATASALLFLLLLTPWEVRNYRTFHKAFPLRDNLGAELRMGNGPGAAGLWMEWAHPTQNVAQLSEYRKLGELGYVAEKRNEAIGFIRSDPGRFVRLSLWRMIYFWAGPPKASASAALGVLHNWFFIVLSVVSLGGLLRAIAHRRQAAFLLFAATALYPVIYYFTFPDPRYRHPIEPLLVILAVYLVSESKELKAAEEPAVIDIQTRTAPAVAD